MKLSAYAKKLGLSYRAVWKQYKRGLIPNTRQLPTGTIIIDEDKPLKKDYVVCYSRVSCSKRRQT